MNQTKPHIPVLLKEVLEALAPKEGGMYLDLTLGAAGHFQEIAQLVGKNGKMIGVDRDLMCIERAKEQFQDPNFEFYHAAWVEALQQIPVSTISSLDGVLIDCGVSSMQLDQAERGFSFRFDAPLDMRMDQTQEFTAKDLIRSFKESDLADVLYEYADEFKSRRIARSIKLLDKQNKMNTTFDLVHAVEQAVGPKRGKIHPATKTFQAIRIKVNEEMNQLTQALNHLVQNGKPGCVLAVITFHSFEDRIVKNMFRDYKKEGKIILQTKKPIVATRDEYLQNPRSRSAKLRVGIVQV